MSPERIRILLVDDQTMFRDGLRVLLSSQADFQIVGEAADGEEALIKAAVLKPQVVLMDLRMPILDGAAATRRLRASQPDCSPRGRRAGGRNSRAWRSKSQPGPRPWLSRFPRASWRFCACWPMGPPTGRSPRSWCWRKAPLKITSRISSTSSKSATA